jgi:hypothetical protein
MPRTFQRLQIHLHFFLQPVGAIRTSGFPNRVPIARKKQKQPFRKGIPVDDIPFQSISDGQSFG